MRRVAAALVLGLLAGCASGPPETATPSSAPATVGGRGVREDGDTGGAVCSPVRQVPLQGGEHLIGDQQPPVPYNSTPPTSGWHSSGGAAIAVHGPADPLSEPEQVSILEAGGVVVTYRRLPPSQSRRLRKLVQGRYHGRVALTPYAALEPGQVALTALGRLQLCDGLDLDAVTAFVERHGEASPDPGH